ncbi:MAG: DUF116 domain-containing protein [Candidatus Tectomicrobia bacterium]|uniref:DUF116 domain-containing protein n=1 Tax=Tectimicrobiota bacterium TaxID=2528274 RepID=A0A932CMW5_UNCTE|nr:DUF116 domain-containing protein [Candidatus Tectomicrobia bacterium]
MNLFRRTSTYISTQWGEEWLFFCLLFLPFLGALAAAYGLLKLAAEVAGDFHPALSRIIQGGTGALFPIAFIMMLLWGIALLTEIQLPFNERIRKVTISTLFPIAILMGRVLHLPKEEIQESFLKVNNKLVHNRKHHILPQKILLLLPRCIQSSTCSIKLAPEGDNCQRCGGCEIKDLWEIVDKYKVKMVVATGGEVARKFIKQINPEAVVAVACTQEMILGIQDTYPLLVLSIVNEWPNGPCIDTVANLDRIEEAIKFFLGNGQTT